jgi:hypothetical protein
MERTDGHTVHRLHVVVTCCYSNDRVGNPRFRVVSSFRRRDALRAATGRESYSSCLAISRTSDSRDLTPPLATKFQNDRDSRPWTGDMQTMFWSFFGGVSSLPPT